MPRDESGDAAVLSGAMDASVPWAEVSPSEVERYGFERYVPHSHLPKPCATCRHRIVNSDRAMFCVKIFRDMPDYGFCSLHEPKDDQNAT